MYDLVVEDFMDKSLQEIIKPGTVTIVCQARLQQSREIQFV